MHSLKIYGGRMGSSFRPHWMLAELGLDYETVRLDMAKQENRSAEYLAINPTGQIPAMVYGDFVLTESAAIANFLAEKHGPQFFGPNTPESHGQLLRWQLFVLLNFDRNFSTLAAKNWGFPATPEKEAEIGVAVHKLLPAFESWLVGKEWLLGADFSVGDVVTRASFMYAEMGGFDLSMYPNITAWMARCAARPAFIKAKG